MLVGDKEFKIQDGGEQTIKCSDCGKPLMHYRVYVPDADINHKFKAECPFCNGGTSFVHEVKGMVWIGPIGKDESVNSTIVVESDMDRSTGVFTFKIKRGG